MLPQPYGDGDVRSCQGGGGQRGGAARVGLLKGTVLVRYCSHKYKKIHGLYICQCMETLTWNLWSSDGFAVYAGYGSCKLMLGSV